FRCPSLRRRVGDRSGHADAGSVVFARARTCHAAWHGVARGQLSSKGRYPVPMPSIRHLLATLLALVLPCALAACVSTPPSAPASPASAAVRTPVLLVSIDGFRADYLDAGLAPNLSRIAGEGVR